MTGTSGSGQRFVLFLQEHGIILFTVYFPLDYSFDKAEYGNCYEERGSLALNGVDIMDDFDSPDEDATVCLIFY